MPSTVAVPQPAASAERKPRARPMRTMSDVTAPGGIAIAKPATRPVTNELTGRTLGLRRLRLVVVGTLVELGLGEREADGVAVGRAVAELARRHEDLAAEHAACGDDRAGDDGRPGIADQLLDRPGVLTVAGTDGGAHFEWHGPDPCMDRAALLRGGQRPTRVCLTEAPVTRARSRPRAVSGSSRSARAPGRSCGGAPMACRPGPRPRRGSRSRRRASPGRR